MSFKIPNTVVKCSRGLLHILCFTRNFPMLYCCKNWKNIIRDYFEADYFWFDFQAFKVPFWNIRSFLSLELESSISRNIRNILRLVFFLIFWARKVLFPVFRGFRFPKYKKGFLLRKYKKFFRGFRFLDYKKFFNIRVRKFHFPKI